MLHLKSPLFFYNELMPTTHIKHNFVCHNVTFQNGGVVSAVSLFSPSHVPCLFKQHAQQLLPELAGQHLFGSFHR